ncbi:hypothetical protein EAX61_11135 [Dokdonia sinensis]|uniref:Carboxypeptidase-like regulatory domain-containing protein n=1 Tax=Dokdonia sinensis TaxID=2479847 RepID=A0A3M0FYU7_9FLAO|nr:carboxypeptidase-like regulatory domain-containing protein [Dokdonia sinensis]RMB57658.1 hypothetical protein EAX61_11135 [Dokdonia sinensis]
MKNSIKITIADPCHEDWTQMTPQEKGRHCDSCDKLVIDFSQTTDEQLYKRVQRGGKICGRFKPEQLDREITLSRKRKNPFLDYAATLLIPAAIFSTQNINASNVSKSPQIETSSYKSLNISSLNRTQKNVVAESNSETLLTIKGTVSDSHGPLSGAIVTVKGTDRFVKTDENGNYKIDIRKGDTLIFDHIAYNRREVIIEKCQKYNVVLEQHMIMGEIGIMGRVSINK